MLSFSCILKLSSVFGCGRETVENGENGERGCLGEPPYFTYALPGRHGRVWASRRSATYMVAGAIFGK
jgi:hypothetical protein